MVDKKKRSPLQTASILIAGSILVLAGIICIGAALFTFGDWTGERISYLIFGIFCIPSGIYVLAKT